MDKIMVGFIYLIISYEYGNIGSSREVATSYIGLPYLDIDNRLRELR